MYGSQYGSVCNAVTVLTDGAESVISPVLLCPLQVQRSANNYTRHQLDRYNMVITWYHSRIIYFGCIEHCLFFMLNIRHLSYIALIRADGGLQHELRYLGSLGNLGAQGQYV